jgi:hypothetical protein
MDRGVYSSMNFDSSPPPFFSDLILFPISLLHQPQRPVPNSNTVKQMGA